MSKLSLFMSLILSTGLREQTENCQSNIYISLKSVYAPTFLPSKLGVPKLYVMKYHFHFSDNFANHYHVALCLEGECVGLSPVIILKSIIK